MASAKEDFIVRIRTLNNTIHNTEALQSRELTESLHNETARMLRNGLAVVGFAALEDFIKKRASEIMLAIGESNVPFDKLPEKLQIATTYEVISALNFQLKLRDKSEKIGYIQEHALKISSTATSNYELSQHTFGYGQPNINAEMITKILISFNVKTPWKQITGIASRLGLTGLPLQNSYTNAATRRHKAAHVANTDTPQLDIAQFVNEAFAIAIGFDFMISKALKHIKNYETSYLDGTNKLKENDVTFRLIKFSDGRWKEYVEHRSRAHRVSDDLHSLCIAAKDRASASSQNYIEFDNTGLINDWMSN